MFDRKMCEHSNGWRPEDGVPDLAMMSDITADGINVNLRTRYMRDQIYTYSGSILIAVNPYKPLQIYDDQWISRYRGQKLDQLDPHIFALTEAMYMNMVMQDYNISSATTTDSEQDFNNSLKSGNKQRHPGSTSRINLKNQACVISGESGAGKTETTKFILSYLCSVTPNKSVWMEHQILEANTILEAFGNAKTVRNDNSSRFGKFIQICFDQRHQINGCIIQDYLLEQSRITYQSIEERNYHVFYQLVAAGRANPELRQKFHLMPANFYNFLNNTQCYAIDGVDDCAMFDSLRTAMSVLNMDQDYCNGLFSILSAILWIGNLQFETTEDEDSNNRQTVEQCHLSDADHEIIETIAELLGVTQEKLQPIMLKRQINVRGSITEIPFKLHEARDNRNAMAKALYSRLFTWVVNFINASINPGSDQTICFLGVLDIFGFENFETNSFEQLCINYANEKLHKFFNHHMFAMEQELYHHEGIEFCDINFTDNTACLELLERPPNCILRLLSEECRMPKGNDTTFIEKLHSEFSSANPNPFYIKGYDRRKWVSEFSVRHFAGLVTYHVDGFLKKNKDSQQSQLLDIMESSSNPLLRDVVNHGPKLENYISGLDTISNSRSGGFRQESADSLLISRTLTQSSTNESCISGSSSGSEDKNVNPPNCSSVVARLQHQHSLRNNHQNGRPLRRDSSLLLDRQSSVSSSCNSSSTKSRPTVADTFRQQLSLLVDLLSSVNPWYVRCIKPNLEKSATDYDDRQVLMQLKYLGMTDLIRIRREGYPIHFTKHQFVCRYRCLMLKYLRTNQGVPPIDLDETRLDSCCLRMMEHFDLSKDDWRIGKTMVLLRAKVYQPLEQRRNQLFADMATMIQSYWKCYVERRRYVKLRNATIRIQETFRAYRGRLLYLRKKRAVLTIQAYVRGMFAREIANALREIKRVEREKALQRELKLQQEKALAEEMAMQKLAQINLEDTEEKNGIVRSKVNNRSSQPETQIVVTDYSNSIASRSDMRSTHEDSPSHTAYECVSPASSATSFNGQDVTDARSKIISSRDRKEMEELVKVLERHGLSLDKLDHNGNGHYSDFEKLYDVLGNQLHINSNYNSQSVSPSTNGDDDRCSFATTATNGDGDSVSCSGQSQVSSTITDDQLANEDKKSCSSFAFDSHNDGGRGSATATTESVHEDTVNDSRNQDAIKTMQDDTKYHSNSIESIASIMSSTSNYTASTNQQQADTLSQVEQQPTIQVQVAEPESHTVEPNNHHEKINPNILPIDPPTKTSTFTGHSLIVSGSKLVTNGRPLTRIEEEPNSATSSPSKTPYKRRREPQTSRPQSLFEPQESIDGSSIDSSKTHIMECKKRRVERKIQQVQQEQLQQPINPTTAGLITRAQDSPQQQPISAPAQPQQFTDCRTDVEADSDQIYGAGKNSIIEYAEQVFNNHSRDTSGGIGMMRTLTRRRRSVDCAINEFLSKTEMLSYNTSFTIPTSHIKMHDPHNEQLSCSIFKNLCKYMTGEGVKFDAEIRIIQSIVRNGIEKQELRDEIYVQVVRQLTNNPNHDYCLRLWALLGLVSAAFAPSKLFAKHLVTYLRNKPRKDPSITCHVQFCLDNLQAPRLNARKYPPSPLEIQACKKLTNLTCKIHLLDGRCETISIHPCDTALETLAKVAQQINLQSIEGWALYESYTPGASKYPHPTFEQKGDFERSIKSQTFMADLIAQWQDRTTLKSVANLTLKEAQKRVDEGNFRLTLKKRIFRGPKIRNDPVEISLLYAQAVHNVVKKDSFYVDESLAISLAGLQAQVMLGNAIVAMKVNQDNRKGKQKSTGPPKISVKSPNQIYSVENFICVRLRNQASRSKKEWCNLIAQAHKQFHNVNEVFCKMRYLSMVIYHCPLYGTATFDVLYKGYQSMDQKLMLGVNAEGLVLIRSSDKALMDAHRYNDIPKEGGITVYTEENIIQLTVKNRNNDSPRCLAFESTDNEEIALLMMSYAPSLGVYIRGSNSSNYQLDISLDQTAVKRKTKLKMTLEDRMRTHQEVQNSRRAIIKSGKLRKPNYEDGSANLFKHTLRRLSSNKNLKADVKPSRFENIYGTLGGRSSKSEISQTSSDYNLYKASKCSMLNELPPEQEENEVAGATNATTDDELTRAYPHRYWAFTKTKLRNSLLIIYDPDLEEAALANFNAILTFSGLLMPNTAESNVNSCNSTLETGSVDSGIASQQSLSNLNKTSGGSPSSASSNEIYDVCPKKLDERDLVKLAQSILDRCLKKDADILKNEFFLQLIKQTTDHPDPNSEINQRHWQLLALACSVTYPSDSKILAYLYAHLRRCSLDQITNEGQYAQFTLRSLQGTLDTRGRRSAPSEIEILSTINCRRVYARVYFLDGQFQAVEFDPCATIAEVVNQIKQKIGLPPNSSGYALFQPLDDDCEQVLHPEDKVGDAMAAWEGWQKQKQTELEKQLQGQQNSSSRISNLCNTNSVNKASLTALNTGVKTKSHKFVFKKYLFIDSLIDLENPVERELLYYQIVASMKEDKLPVLEQEATLLCALKAQIEIGEYAKLAALPREHARMVYKQIVISLMPPRIFNNLQIPAIAHQHQVLGELSSLDAKKYFFRMIQSCGIANLPNNPGYILLHRSYIYDATQTFATAWPFDIWIVVNQSGVHMVVAKSRRVLASCEYRLIIDYKANGTYLIILVLGASQSKLKYTFYSKQAQQIAQQIKDYMVMNSSSGNKRRKSVEFNLKQQSTATKAARNSEIETPCFNFE